MALKWPGSFHFLLHGSQLPYIKSDDPKITILEEALPH
jgi:hypothetical protein